MVVKKKACGDNAQDHDDKKPSKTQEQQFGCSDTQPHSAQIVRDAADKTHSFN